MAGVNSGDVVTSRRGVHFSLQHRRNRSVLEGFDVGLGNSPVSILSQVEWCFNWCRGFGNKSGLGKLHVSV